MPRRNREARNAYHRDWIAKNREKVNAERLAHYHRNKDDINERRRLRRLELKAERLDGYTYVYYLPEEHYVGITCDLKERLADHKKTKIINGWEVIARFERRVDARWFECMFHQRGYRGGDHY